MVNGGRIGLLVAVTVGLVGGCLGEPDTFVRRGARLACKRIEACDSAMFEDDYSGERSICRDDIESNTQFSFDALAAMGCEYSRDRAHDCLGVARKRAKDCSDEAKAAIDSACAEVYDCSGVAPGG